MSFVTDLVFILPWAPADDQANQERFEASFREAHGWEIAPQEGAGKFMATEVYIAGVNHIDWRWVDSIRAQQWPEGTVLWLHPEGCGSEVGQPIVYQLGRGGEQR